MTERPLVAHLLYRLDVGGLESLLVDCVNRMPQERYRHAIVCLTDYTDFAQRIARPDVTLHALHKPPGMAPAIHAKVWRLLRRLRPAILHSYNLAAIEYVLPAKLAGVPVCVHAEHGRDAADPEGRNPRHRLLRRLLNPWVDTYVPVSVELRQWLRDAIGVPDARNLMIANGVDTNAFSPGAPPPDWPFPPGSFVIGTVGRLQAVKDQLSLVDAFVRLRALLPAERERLRLVIVGSGPLRGALLARLAEAGAADAAWLPGARADVAQLMRGFSVFALSSIAEGTPVTLLEAMATGLPVVSTAVGGIPDVVRNGTTGTLVPPKDPAALGAAIAEYLLNPQRAARHGAAARERIERDYSMTAMLAAYTALYDRLLASHTETKAMKSCAE